MKRILLTAALLLTATTVLAGFKVPKGIYSLDEMEKATERALNKGRPMVFVLSDTETTCPLCIGATTRAFEFYKGTVLVYVNSGSDFNELPETVSGAFRSEESGRYIPKVVVTSPDGGEVFSIVPYAGGEEYEKILKDSKKTTQKAFKEWKVAQKEKAKEAKEKTEDEK